MANLVITPVAAQDRKALSAFIQFPKQIYRHDPMWTAPLDLEQKELLTDHNPFFRHGRAQYWIARRGGEIVGRISAQVDDLYQPAHGAAVGYFGQFECVDDVTVASALFEKAERWLSEQGCTVVHGPFNLSINSSCGLLVDGYDTPPYMMMGHALRYFPQLIEQCGYAKAKDLLAYRLDIEKPAPAVTQKLRQRFAKKVRLGDIRDYPRARAYEIMRDIFNDAWMGNWGFVPFTEEEFTVMGKNLNLIMDPRQAQFAYVDDEPVGMMVTLPDINQAIRGLNGRLLPLGWARLLWRLKVSGTNRVRVPLMGVRRKLHGTTMAGGVAFTMLMNAWDIAVAAGNLEAELSWILEDNDGIKDVIERVGGLVYKRYRVYEKAIAS